MTLARPARPRHRRLCLDTEGTTYGSPLDLAPCNGSAREQWEVGTDGLIAWIYYLCCIGEAGAKGGAGGV